MKKIVLMGNPNVGKSVVFSRLTGADVLASNYPGTTIDFSRGHMSLGKEKYQVIDAPGTYSLEPTNRAEEVSIKILKKADIILNVLDATNLERNLYLCLQLLEMGKPQLVALNMWDETKHQGIDIDVAELSKFLGIKVIPTVALTGSGISQVVENLADCRPAIVKWKKNDSGRWKRIGEIVSNVQILTHRHHTLKDRISEATIKPITGIPISILVIILTFWLVRIIGEGLINYAMNPLFDLLTSPLMELSYVIEEHRFIHDMLIGKLIDGEIDYTQSMGMLTTGLYMPVGMVMPYIASFYFMLAILEDTGYLPRMSTLADNIFHKLGMHGHGIISVFLGVGCNVPGALATRNLVTRKQRFIAATLLSISVPCMAQTALIFGILGRYGLGYIFLVFLILISIYLGAGLILNRFIKGESPEIFLEVPPYRRPPIKVILKKTWMRVKWFLTEAVPFMFLGVLIINVFYSLGILDLLADTLSPFMGFWLGLPGEATPALLIGFLRKDLAVGMLISLDLSAMQLVIASVILTIYFPCVATFAVLLKELGGKDMLKASGIMVLTALLVGGLLRFTLLGI